MSIRIRIGQDEREFNQADEHWIISRIKQEQADQGNACIRIFIKAGDIDVILSSGGCPKSEGGGGRKPTAKEQEFFNLWRKLGLNANEVTGGKVNAFLKQARRII